MRVFQNTSPMDDVGVFAVVANAVLYLVRLPSIEVGFSGWTAWSYECSSLTADLFLLA